jgi:hypothetical protein
MSAPPNYTNVTLMKAMGAKKYDPMPTDQHQWQRAEGEPMVHRIWSVLCACSIRARLVGTRLVTTPYATEDDGVSPLTMVGLAKLLGEEDAGNVRQAWKRGEELGIWRRESGKLWLNGRVTEAQVSEAKKIRNTLCTNLLTRADLLKIKGWPKEKREEFQALWNAVHDYEQARIAEATWREREVCAPVKDNIKLKFDLEIRHVSIDRRRSAAVPPQLLEFVQTGEYEPKNGNVQTPATLLPAEKPQRASSTSSNGSGVVATDQPQAENPEGHKVAEILSPLPPDMAAAENQRRQPKTPSNMGDQQSGDHAIPTPADALYLPTVRAAAQEVGLTLREADIATARAWCARRVPLSTVRHALFLGAHRHLSPATKGVAIAPIQSLAFFEPVIQELLTQADPGEEYMRHVERRFRRDSKRVATGEFAREWADRVIADPRAGPGEKKLARQILGIDSKTADGG